MQKRKPGERHWPVDHGDFVCHSPVPLETLAQIDYRATIGNDPVVIVCGRAYLRAVDGTLETLE